MISLNEVFLSTAAMTAATEDWADSMVAAAEPPTVEVKLFGKWNPDEIHVNDISLAVSGFVSEDDKRCLFVVNRTTYL